MAKERAKRQRRNRSVTIYGRFLQWVRFKYALNQSELADIMGTSQSTVSNWEIGEYEASWRANSRMADELDFDPELRRLSGLVFAYGQGTPAPAEEPADFPYSLVGSLGKGCTMTASGTFEEKTPRDGVRVRTSVPDGRKYVDSNELIRSKKARKQMDQLRKTIGKGRITSG